MINGSADLPHDKMKAAPWLQELKMSQVKKSSSQGKIITNEIVLSRFVFNIFLSVM